MQMLYNSDSFAVVQFDVPSAAGKSDGKPGDGASGGDGGTEAAAGLTRGGYEIVDKFARKEIFIEGAMAQSFKEGVEALIETRPSEEEIDAYIERYSSLMQHPVLLH